MTNGRSRSPTTPPTGSLLGRGLAFCTVMGRCIFWAAVTNAGSISTCPKKLFAGTTINVSLVAPVT